QLNAAPSLRGDDCEWTRRNPRRPPFRAVGVIYSPASAHLPTLETASIGRSGRIQYVMTMAKSNRQTETANGSVQLPVRSRIQAKATGERMPATAPEAFISELEVPAKSGAMSIVAVHSGEIAKPRENTVTMKPDTPTTMSWKRITGTRPATANTQLMAIINERAIGRLPVRRSKASVVIPPISSARNPENSSTMK